MKNLNIRFTDAEFRKLSKAKRLSGQTNWSKFIIIKCTKGISEKQDTILEKNERSIRKKQLNFGTKNNGKS